MTTRKFVYPATTGKRFRQALAALVSQENGIGTNSGGSGTTASDGNSTNTSGATGAGGSGSSLHGQAGGKQTSNKVTQTLAFGGEIVIIDRIYPSLMQAVVVYRSTGKSAPVLIGSNMISDDAKELFRPDGVDYYDHSVNTYYRKPKDKNLTGIVMNIDGNQNEMAVLLCYIRMPGEKPIVPSNKDLVIGDEQDGQIIIPTVTANEIGTVLVTIPDKPSSSRIWCFITGSNQGTAQIKSINDTTYTIQYQFNENGTNEIINYMWR